MILMKVHARTGPIAVASLEKMLAKVQGILGDVSLYLPTPSRLSRPLSRAQALTSVSRATQPLKQVEPAGPRAEARHSIRISKLAVGGVLIKVFCVVPAHGVVQIDGVGLTRESSVCHAL